MKERIIKNLNKLLLYFIDNDKTSFEHGAYSALKECRDYIETKKVYIVEYHNELLKNQIEVYSNFDDAQERRNALEDSEQWNIVVLYARDLK